ncbi:uncharacterized protein LOC120340975 [Styela clava]|uniref:uncharacterized protein LOC120340975 n=1 Tax=Styela clava TaxID=7725 RepID=UPI00193AB223|nr:uncharacterized protein LOC120340975 [Styela clava]
MSSLRLFTATASVIILLTISSQIRSSDARSNGLIQRCGSDARDFLRWFCRDQTFDFPFPFNRIHLVRLFRPPYKNLFPFQHQASVCCRSGCPESSYQRMCQYHHKLKSCEKRRHVHPKTREGRRSRRLSLCRLSNSIS